MTLHRQRMPSPEVVLQRAKVIARLGDGPMNVAELRAATGLSSYEIYRALYPLRRDGAVDPPLGEGRRGQPGRKGRYTIYRLV